MKNLRRSKHNLSHYELLSCGMGQLIPIGLTEALPGDTFQHQTSALIRTNPLLSPVMHPVEVRIHHFFVPTRLVWEDFEDFITGGEDGSDVSVFPTITLNDTTGAEGSLADYLGVPTVPTSGSLEVSAIPFRIYNLIHNNYYRDQDLVDAQTVDITSGADTTTNTSLLPIAWEKDYFTSARADAQKGDDITISLGTTAPVVSTGANPTITTSSTNTNQALGAYQGNGVNRLQTAVNFSTSALEGFQWGNESGLEADISAATGININDLRLSFAVQRMREARQMYGSRYTEYLAYLGVRAQDSRLQRPEYLGGGKQTIQFSEVLATAEGTSTDVGDLKGHGIAAMRSNRYRRHVPEHGYIMSFISVRPKTMYMQALSRMWNKRTKEEFFQPELQFIGDQVVKNKEVYAPHSSPDGTFGYSPRYEEYRKQENAVHGEFRSTLNYWHMARDFASEPALNSTFVQCSPTDRIFADTSTDPLLIMAKHTKVARRMVSKIATSKIL